MKIIGDYRYYRIKFFHVLNTICKERKCPTQQGTKGTYKQFPRHLLGDQWVCTDPGQSQLLPMDLQLGSVRISKSGSCHNREASDRHRLLSLELPPADVLQKEKGWCCLSERSCLPHTSLACCVPDAGLRVLLWAQAGGCPTVQDTAEALQGGWKHQSAPSPSYHLLCLAAERLPVMAATRGGPSPPTTYPEPIQCFHRMRRCPGLKCAKQFLLFPEHEVWVVSWFRKA